MAASETSTPNSPPVTNMFPESSASSYTGAPQLPPGAVMCSMSEIMAKFHTACTAALHATEPPLYATRENITPTSVPPTASSATPAGEKAVIDVRCTSPNSSDGSSTARALPHRASTRRMI